MHSNPDNKSLTPTPTPTLISMGVLTRNNTPTRCKKCGSTWGIHDLLMPTGSPHSLVGKRVYTSKTITCGMCGREVT